MVAVETLVAVVLDILANAVPLQLTNVVGHVSVVGSAYPVQMPKFNSAHGPEPNAHELAGQSESCVTEAVVVVVPHRLKSEGHVKVLAS